MRKRHFSPLALIWTILFLIEANNARVFAQLAPAVTPTGEKWTANATLKNVKTVTVEKIGAGQGVSEHDGKFYFYGDVHNANPRCGVIREFDRAFKPTGKLVWLRKNGQPVMIHPTGLTWDKTYGCFLGDTVDKKAKIYQLDWPRALADGTLDNAIIKTINDDVAINGCRPLFVTVKDKTILATADYGETRPMIRLYDVEKLLANGRSSAPGVVVHSILAGPFNQNLAWDAEHKQLTCIQNVIAGIGWQLDVIDLPRAIADGRVDGPNVRVRRVTFVPRNELEGFLALKDDQAIYVTSHHKDNVTIGQIETIPARESAPGEKFQFNGASPASK
jgi:hypothetical protein